MSPPKELNS